MATSKKKPTTKTKTKTAKVNSPAQKAKRELWSLGNLLSISIVLYVALAIAVIALLRDTAFPVTITHLTNNALVGTDGTAFITANRPLFDVDLRWMLLALLAVSAVTPLLYLTKLKSYYAQRVEKRRVLEARWIDLGINSAIMVGVIAMFSGITDLMYLKLLGGFMVITCILGWLAERQNERATSPVWTAFNISLLAGVMPWLAIGVTKSATLFYGGIRSPWYVYVACFAALIGFGLLARNQYRQHRRQGKFADYPVVERNYQTITLVTKVSFVVALLIGLA